MSRKGDNKGQSLPKRANSIQVPIQNPSNFITNEKSKKLIGKRNEVIAR